MFYIYVIQHIVTHKCYVGKSNEPARRFRTHCRLALKGNLGTKTKAGLIHRALAKYGEINFKFEIIEEWLDEKEAFEAEAFWVEYLRSDVSRFGSDAGYNLTPGGEGWTGGRHTPESKMKIAEGARRLHIDNPSLGLKLAEAAKRSRLEKSKAGAIVYFGESKATWPPPSDVIDSVNRIGYAATGRDLGVSDQAVRLWLKRRGLLSQIIAKPGWLAEKRIRRDCGSFV